MKKERSLHQKKELKVTILFLIVVCLILLGLLAISKHRWENQFEYEESLEETLFSYGEKEVKLRNFGYYVLIEEESVNEYALDYDEDNPYAYWNMHVDGAFVSEEAKQVALNYCIRDYLYAEKAKEAGITLSEIQIEEIKEKARGIANNLTEKQKSIQLTEDDVYMALYNNCLADAWVLEMAEEEDLTISEDVLSAYYGMNSYFYKDLMEEMNVTVNKKLLDELSMGRITIN